MRDLMRVVCLSDTHGLHRGVTVPDGDILIHAGDFAVAPNDIDGIREFDRWLAELPHRFKIVVPGNHEFFLEQYPVPHSLFRNAILLINEQVDALGLRIWGSPVTPLYAGAFGLSSRYDRRKLYATVPYGIDILATHGPPYGFLDVEPPGGNAGCLELLEAVERVTPKFHIFGHIHGAYGLKSSPVTTFVNAALMGAGDRLEHSPIVLEIERPQK
jgi:Icc-related predicted phosphoesterase